MIVNASNSEENQLTASPNIMIEIKDKIIPKVNASDGSIFFEGIGLFFVLSIILSISLSYHWFNAPDAPAPIAIANIPMVARIGFKGSILLDKPTK